MRLIGNVDSKTHAERLSAFLTTRDISNHFEQENDSWQIWVRDEDHIEEASELLREFAENPEVSKYDHAVAEAQTIIREQEKKIHQAKKNLVQMQDRWNAPLTRRAPLTIALVVICIVVLFMTSFGDNVTGATFRALALASLTEEQAVELVGTEGLGSFSTPLRLGSLAYGQLWRMITPIFIHFGPWHLLFNMYWLVIFGSQIESRYGALWLAVLVVLIAIPSNLSGAMVPEELDGVAIARGEGFWIILLGGFSGVLYGMFGYIWMKMVFDPQSGLFITRTTATILMIFLILCMTPVIEAFGFNPANWAHGVGFVTGLIIGYTPKLLNDIGLGRPKQQE